MIGAVALCLIFTVFWAVAYPREYFETLLFKSRAGMSDIVAGVAFWVFLLTAVGGTALTVLT